MIVKLIGSLKNYRIEAKFLLEHFELAKPSILSCTDWNILCESLFLTQFFLIGLRALSPLQPARKYAA